MPPPDPNVMIWRYMDFTKYVALLESGCLFFSRSDRFDDPYEGATSHANKLLRTDVYQDIPPPPPDAFDLMSRFAEWVRQWTYVNCWHMNEHESAAMWKLYAHTAGSVAIRSTFELLRQSLPESSFLGTVKYINYETDWLPEGNSLWPFVHKRKSFEHERELRAVIQNLPSNGQSILADLPNPTSGRPVPLDLSSLIQEVYVSPSAPVWFSELALNVTRKYGLSFEVRQSLMTKQPIF